MWACGVAKGFTSDDYFKDIEGPTLIAPEKKPKWNELILNNIR